MTCVHAVDNGIIRFIEGLYVPGDTRQDHSLLSALLQLKAENMKADVEASLPAGQELHAIRCRDVCRSYGKLKVLSNLNLTVPQGQM